MKKSASTIFILFLSITLAFSQAMSLKEQALESFKAEHYNEAIALLEQALEQTPDDAEIHYYLGFFKHYLGNDSRLLAGYDAAFSEQIFKHLNRAIKLNPNFGDAKYFYGAERCANAEWAMQNYDLERLKYAYERAFKIGAYPDWLLEFGRNFLAGCSENAILFTGGDVDLGVSRYLQLFENVRPDITIIPIGNIDRPWYIQFFRNGMEGAVRNINLNLTDAQIMEIRPFKWRETNVFIDISPADRLRFGLSDDFRMEWTIEPDLQSGRIHSKIAGEEPFLRTLLSPQRAMILQIVEDNFAERPIYFSSGANPFFMGGLEEYLQLCGLVFRLTPIKTADTQHWIDEEKIQQLLRIENLVDYNDVKKNDIPRVSGIITHYSWALVNLAESYRIAGRTEELKQLIDFYRNHLRIDFNIEYEQFVIERLENLLNELVNNETHIIYEED
jgi:tetratricopeptide (TPR) repeat protein